ncbi:aromatic ring-hydroxylating dioxygenase subunit alpha [Tsuneonella sp. CC-YZS046]|uniref:aromatic ring-hydroxylating oxygenase subunit alpha n=1 Tax=Tsuneonella sp. CC-YZS046 TaxID=3042152 RepID=UPI002D792E5D|nr:aromatic ring-hydroxylating dioxygenase subunit alpha [Tsuneonella sp. CC-YZS046]WRO66685.1 aromatic ring-hydroxylating dioxygenase subunit alpha [Tsuneonella sp. CC-YZS046]
MDMTREDFTGRGTFTERFGLDTEVRSLEPYRSREFFELEREKVFDRAWLYMAREEELPEQNSFIVKQLYPRNISVLITRDASGHIQAFHNSCPHRGGIVVRAEAGRASRFSCQYHKWTFNNKGSLLGVPDEENFFPSLQKSACGLKKISTAMWEGWIFVNLMDEPEVTLEEFLGPIKDYLSGMIYLGAHNPVVYTAVLEANWKAASDAFIETYHIPHIHKQTIGSTFAGTINPHSRLISAQPLGPHRTISAFGNTEYAADPNSRVEKLGSKAGEAGNVIAQATLEDAADYLKHPAVNPNRTNHWSMDINQVFPNFHIDTNPGGFLTHQFWPMSENQCFYEVRFYMNEAKHFRERFLQELYIARVGEVVLEDLSNLWWTQRGIESSGTATMHLQDSEVAIRHSLDHVLKWTQSATVKEALA